LIIISNLSNQLVIQPWLWPPRPAAAPPDIPYPLHPLRSCQKYCTTLACCPAMLATPPAFLAHYGVRNCALHSQYLNTAHCSARFFLVLHPNAILLAVNIYRKRKGPVPCRSRGTGRPRKDPEGTKAWGCTLSGAAASAAAEVQRGGMPRHPLRFRATSSGCESDGPLGPTHF
jgi:hypothetical protein